MIGLYFPVHGTHYSHYMILYGRLRSYNVYDNMTVVYRLLTAKIPASCSPKLFFRKPLFKLSRCSVKSLLNARHKLKQMNISTL